MADSKQKDGRSVLLVDDDRFLLDIYSLKFRERGFNITAEADSTKALGLLREDFNPDIILLDIIMPTLDGFDFMEAIKKEKLAKKTTLIVLSNQGQDEDLKKAMDLGAVGYIIKASAIPSEVLEKTIELAAKK